MHGFYVVLFCFKTMINISPPAIPVITPIGSSFGEIIVRAAISLSIIKILPPKNDAGNNIR